MKNTNKKFVGNVIWGIIMLIFPAVLLISGLILNHWALIMWGCIGIAVVTFVMLPNSVKRKIENIFFSDESHQ